MNKTIIITQIALCSCGVITVTINGEDYCIPREMFETKFDTLERVLESISNQDEIQILYSCNYCENGWGLYTHNEFNYCTNPS